MELKYIKDLYQIRKKENLDKVIIYTKNFKYSGLINYAIKFALWSVKDNGIVLIKNSNKHYKNKLIPHSYDFKLLIHKVISIMRNFDMEVSIDKKNQEIEIIKENIPFDNNWSIGVMFSGSSEEFNQVVDSINVLQNLTLKKEAKLEVLVCGPSIERKKFENFSIKYVDYNEKNNNRFLINKKKNHLIRQMQYSNCCVLHSRIFLDKDCLYNMPNHFDVIVPKIFYKNKDFIVPDNDLIFYQWNKSFEYITSAPTLKDYNRYRYLSFMKNAIPCADGACLIAKKEIFYENMLEEKIAWTEAEDVEWMKRLYLSNNILELSLESKAFSVTTKTSKLFLSMPSYLRYIFRRIFYLMKVAKGSIHRYD
ncbi:MAG: hypothetical protein CMF53_00080 [Legionellales bacterium]|nr:hypothetical protein [Legionellales bacterium]|tara:strand:+ start:750 stop:1844 length:1095 start_codon:yes stop_codon:yes gene_type:complete